jgi:hypothetical protein
MKRSVRNGIAIAGMAGGIWFLGSAVASADDGQTADATTPTSQTASSESTGDGGSLNAAGNLNASSADATNVQATEVDTDVDGGDGGDNGAAVNTGVITDGYVENGQIEDTLSVETVKPEPEAEPIVDVTVHTGDVSVTQNADGGDVNGSGNVKVSGNSGDQTATAENNVHQTATSTSTEEDEHGDRGYKGKNGHDDGSLNLAGNVNESDSDATNIDVTDIDTDVDGGDGGTNEAEINTGIIGNTFYCPAYSTCYFNFTTGDVTVVQNANGGDVSDSGNVNVGGDGYGHPHADHHGDQPGHHHDGDCPDDKPTVKPSVKPASAPTYRAPVSPTAQPAGQLAYTGADVSLPLTVGLIALGAGFALTAAGRRRVTETV